MRETQTAKNRVITAVAVTVLMVVGWLAVPNTPQAHAQTGRAYVAMGDSFPANPDIPEQLQGLITGECAQRSDAYPDLIGWESYGGNYVNLACNGTTLTGQAGPGLIHNMNAAHARGEVGANTQLVTITAGAAEGWNPAVPGGRDFGFLDGANYVTPQSWTDRMGPVVNRINQIAPNARIMVVGYPEVGDGRGGLCLLNVSGGTGSSGSGSGAGNLPVAVPTGFENFIDRINGMAASHQHLGYEYVDTAQPGTGTCAHPAQQWVRAVIDIPGAGDGIRMPVHPTAIGDRGVADLVKSRI